MGGGDPKAVRNGRPQVIADCRLPIANRLVANFPIRGHNRKLVGIGLDASANDPGIHSEGQRDTDDVVGKPDWHKEFHPMPHVEHLVHFLPGST